MRPPQSAERGTLAKPEATQEWPCLPRRGFVAGRAARRSDVRQGDAVFTAVSDQTVIGTPLCVIVPQYAYLRTTAQRGVLVQAEAVRGMRAFGFRALDGTEVIATDAEIELLGTARPE